jgi:hypothetical protein
MKRWNIKVKNSVQVIIKKLDSSLGGDRFVFDMDEGENDSATFKVHKRGLYAFYLMFVNKIIVDGKILKTDTENESNIEISFTQYFLWKLIIFTHMFLGLGFLAAIISKGSSSIFMYIFGAILLALLIVLWITVQNKFKKDVEEYKTLISGIVES